MDGNNLAMVHKGGPPRVPKEPHMKQQDPPKGIPVYGPQWTPAYCHSHAGYCKGRSAYNSTLGVYATPVHIQSQAPRPSAQVHGDHTDPMGRGTHREWSDAGHHWHSIWRGSRPIQGHDGSQNSNPTAGTSHHWKSVHRYIHFCTEGIVGLELGPVVEDHPALTLQELSDMDDWNPHPPFGTHPPISYTIQFSHPACMPWCFHTVF